MSDQELDALLADLQRVAADQVADVWARNFAADIAVQAISPSWRPSLRQANVSRRLAREALDSDSGDMIESDGGGGAR